MCGIIARVGDGDALGEILGGLRNLEYRGYDSAGVALRTEDGIDVYKREGETDALVDAIGDRTPDGTVGIGHTRWSTHGAPSDANAHPHTDDEGRVAVVHNGIIKNHESLRRELRADGHTFTSETDTEVVPHLVSRELAAGADPETAFRRAVDRIEGSYALAMVVADEDAVYATRSGSPLVLGLGSAANYLASDVPAFLEFTDRVVYVEDDEVVVLDGAGYRISDPDGETVERAPETVEWTAGDAQKGVYNHFMRKEIDEQPVCLRQTVDGRLDVEGRADGGEGGGGTPVLDALPPGELSGIANVVFVACGTSYHAAMYGCVLLKRLGIPATAMPANEFAHDPMPVGDETLVVAVTQSGETADTLASLRAADASPARTLAVTNVVGSTAARMADDAVFIRAGPEIGVAATKTFSSQVATLAMLAERLADDGAGVGATTPGGAAVSEAAGWSASLASLPDLVETVVEDGGAARLAEAYADAEAYFFIGRGTGYPVALEGALKFKEITYEHAEGFAAGELKHGPLALVTPATVVVAVFTGRNDDVTLHNVREAQSRGAPVLGVGPASSTAARDAVDEYLEVPDADPELVGVLANVHLQLLAYHAAAIRDRAIDKPRNLAKSVTVE
ncbi:glutamine--fructose-6-phosphate transaminase (isomerizing) [Halorubrum sp. Atlit-26R]|uniref:glutamine--fructose-6-phosphate transaminase (isomerizing) n=1 Tax=Halorubrum sp. Atlit-26R TaxID=2282128 RepID=UPI000EF1E880|nr:glutamine--fructose-6-phosphate transaminase (isomerizing) [Halorubrum sp. Atlit-26R]RLM64174.1 glutamine--fructose-6-phosphate transaminase (isomerizing) [Halorubrum sp. Atlit-26R]